jgi:signal peptidase II
LEIPGGPLKLFRTYFVLFFIAAIVVVFDQWTKWLVLVNIPINKFWLPDSLLWLFPYARIVHWYNKGAAFGMFQGGWVANLIFSILVINISELILYYFPLAPKNDRVLRFTLGLFMGGAMGNLIDRIRLGHVLDFVSVGRFPVFNVADASISVGAVIFFYLTLDAEKDDLWGLLKNIHIWKILKNLIPGIMTWFRTTILVITKKYQENRILIASFLKSYAVLLFFSGLLVVLDQWLKSVNPVVPQDLSLNENILLRVLLLHTLELVLFTFPQIDRRSYFVKISLGLIFAGGLSTLIDIFTLKDIRLIFASSSFDIADLCFVVGTLMLFVGAASLLRNSRNRKDMENRLDVPGETARE